MKTEDIFENILICNKCNKKTRKDYIIKQGFKIRIWKCPKCSKVWYHPVDSNKYLEWNKVKNSKFDVKLRTVGNSWVVSIPKEIARFSDFNIGERAVWAVNGYKKLVLNINMGKIFNKQ